MSESRFSSALKLTDLDDFIAPSQACTKPEIIERKTNKKAKIEVKADGTYLEYDQDGNDSVLEAAKISLNDCLACSGCVTSAESVLISAQSTQEFLSNLDKGFTVVISLSPQSRASIAAHFKLSIAETHRKLVTFFKKIGVHYVFDTSFSREFSLMESAAEFVARYKQQIDSPLPMLASACPGWVCYAEKTHGEFVLPFISTSKSPQQVMGTIVKRYFAEKIGVSADRIYHTTVMPCYDKKLEASRDDFYNDILKTRDVDCVLTSGEILDILAQKSIQLQSLEEGPVDSLFTNIDSEGQLFGESGSSGGYLEYIFRYAAKELFGVTVDQVNYKTVGRSSNNDYLVTTLEVEGKQVLTFAIAYGFKNIQNVVRKMKQTNKKERLDFVEVMACPGGCLNGGGQIRPEKGESSRSVLKRVEAAYNEQVPSTPQNNEAAANLYQIWLSGVFSPDAKTHLHTQYHTREKVFNPLAIKW